MKKVLAAAALLVVLAGCGSKKTTTVTKVNNIAQTTTAAAVVTTPSAVIQTTVQAVTTAKAIDAGPPDAAVIIHENTLNNFLRAMGKISGKAPFEVLFIKGEYDWSLQNARIDISPNNAKFSADANVSIGNIFSYSSIAEGNVDVWYDNVANKIHVKIREAIFEVYFKMMGNKVHITNIDAAKYYKPEFEFAGPQPMQTEINITLPDFSNKKINVKITGQNLLIEKDQIKVTSSLRFEQAAATTGSAVKTNQNLKNSPQR